MNNIDQHSISDEQPTDKWRSNYLARYVFSTDPQTVAKQFLITGIMWALLAVALIVLLRILLAYPATDISWVKPLLGKWLTPAGTVDPQMLQSLATIHGTILIYFVLNAGLSGGFANFLLSNQFGTRSLFSPGMLRASFWLFLSGSILLLLALFAGGPLPRGGWVLHPFLGVLMHDPNVDYTYYFAGIGLCTIGALAGSLNRIVTIQRGRTEVNLDIRKPLIWSFFVTDSIGILLFMTQLLVLISLVFFDIFEVSLLYSPIFDKAPDLNGPRAFSQHLSWLLGHTELYLLILPALGILTEIISSEASKPIRNPNILRHMFTAIGILTFFVWLFQQFTPGTYAWVFSLFSLFTSIIALAILISVVQWLTIIRGSNLRLHAPTLFGTGAIAALGMGGLLGLWSGLFGAGFSRGSYTDVAHFHIGLGVAGVLVLFAAVYYWFPNIFGRYMNPTMGKIHFWGTLFTAFGATVPMVYLGAAGMFRNTPGWSEFRMFDGIIILQQWITFFAILGSLFQIVFTINFFRSISYGSPVKNDVPWEINPDTAEPMTFAPSEAVIIPGWAITHSFTENNNRDVEEPA